MKKLLVVFLFCLILAGCVAEKPAETETPTAPPATAAPTEATTEIPTESPTEAPTEAAVVKFTIYTPNENADGFYDTVIVIETLTAGNVLDELIKENVLSEEIVINSAHLEDSQLTLDFNSAFRDQLLTYGTAGERMIIGSVVNTFLSAYGAETVMITVDGEILESGHVVYDFPLSFMN